MQQFQPRSLRWNRFCKRAPSSDKLFPETIHLVNGIKAAASFDQPCSMYSEDTTIKLRSLAESCFVLHVPNKVLEFKLQLA
jgi:hypothetical protein